MKHFYVLFSIALCALGTSAQIPLDYYADLNGKHGSELKDAIHKIIGQDPAISMLSYGSGNNHTWWGFYVTDRREDNSVVDRYSYDVRYFGDRGSSISGMNIEHSFPKSWWGGATNNAYKDLFNLMPCEASINSSKSNYPMGEVVRVTTAGGDNGCTRVGEGEDGYKYWEPADEWKGDFARGYMYMATAYQNLTWSGSQALLILQNGSYPTLKPVAYELYLKWARADKVNEIEVKRCSDVYDIQHNRNPYVDFPNLMEYVWGDSMYIDFNVLTTVKSNQIIGSSDVTELYASTFLGDQGGCSIENVTVPNSSFAVWSNSAQYGWTGKGARGSSDNITCYETDALLLTPEIDLSGFRKAALKFEHAVNYCSTPKEYLSVLVKDCDTGVEKDISDRISWPSGSSWKFNSSGNVDLTDFAGRLIRVIFRYTSSTAVAGTWEIKNLSINGSDVVGVEQRLIDTTSGETVPAEYYSIDGRRVNPLTYRGVVIRRQGTQVTKTVLR